MTNGDKIRNMANEELAVEIMCPYDINEEFCSKKEGCYFCCLEWLEEEVEE